MSEWIDICSTDNLQANSGICALLNGEQIAIFYMPVNNAIYAISNYDPVGKVNVLSRGLIGDLKGIPMLSSPLYKHHYNLQTGECIDDSSLSVKIYAIRIQQDRVEINLEENL